MPAPPRVAILSLLIGLAVPSLGQSPSNTKHYHATEVPLHPVQINDSGLVLGTTKYHRIALWSKRQGLRLLGPEKPLGHMEPTGLNNQGQVSAASDDTAFLFTRGKFAALTGKHSKALAVSDTGVVVGQATVPGMVPIMPVMWRDGILTGLGGCCGGTARSVNSAGRVVGDMYDAQGRFRAFFWTAAQGIRFLGDEDSYSSAIAVNASGHVLVQARESRVLVYDGIRQIFRIQVPEQQPARGRALNDADVVVGSFGPYSDADHAFLWSEKEGFHDLNDLIPEKSGWKLEYASSINNAGQIVGIGDRNGQDDAGFLLDEDTAQAATPSRHPASKKNP